jgi:hypothetical protein
MPEPMLRHLLLSKDMVGRDAWTRASEEKNPAVSRKLLSLGAVPTFEAYAAAIKNECKDTLRMLMDHGNIDCEHDDFEEHTWPELYGLQVDLTPIVEALLREKWDAFGMLFEGGAYIPDLAWCLTKAIKASEPSQEVLR